MEPDPKSSSDPWVQRSPGASLSLSRILEYTGEGSLASAAPTYLTGDPGMLTELESKSAQAGTETQRYRHTWVLGQGAGDRV